MRLAESRFCMIASGVLVLVLLGCGIVVYELRRFEGLLADDLCRVDVRRIVSAPDASSALVTFEVDCGATTPVSTQINLVPNGASFSREAFPSFLSIKGRHDLVPRWLGAEVVEVAVPSNVEYYRKMDAVGGVRVSYRGESAQR